MQDLPALLNASRIFLVCVLVASIALAAPPRSDVDALRWVAGEWQADGPTGRVDAFWLPPGGPRGLGPHRHG